MVQGNRSEILKLIGEEMRARRLSLNLSQELAAARSGISLTTVKSLEYGRGASLWALVSLCRTYGHDNWVLELGPTDSLAWQLDRQEGGARQRAAKRSAVKRV